MITRRRMLAATGGLAGLAAAGAAAAQTPTVTTPGRNGTMQITRGGSQPSRKGPAEYFTGAVRVDPLFQAPDPARVSWRQRHIRAGRPHRLAYPSARPDI